VNRTIKKIGILNWGHLSFKMKARYMLSLEQLSIKNGCQPLVK